MIRKCFKTKTIKIKISMIYVSKEYEIKTKMVQEQWLQLKMMFLSFYREGMKIWRREYDNSIG